MAQFSNALIKGGTFNSAEGDIHITHQNNRDSEPGLHALSLAISHGAIHDSAERYPPANCHPGTRKAVRQIILNWIDNEKWAFPFFWLYGPAGVGKTAILQAIAEFLCSSSGYDGKLGGSFFFSRGKRGRNQGHFLFLTIAYQLALKVPGLRQHINRIMENDPTLHTKSIAAQVQALIVDAFQSLSHLPQHSYLVIIDGLDECQDKATQQFILHQCEAITARKLPLRFLIGSRPESDIRASFDQEALYTITRRVVLDEAFKPGKDIKVFLQDGFAEICTKHADILSHVKKPWPAKGIIDHLVQRSSGQFIYAATVLKFVGADFFSPTKQLNLVLMPNSTAFSDLDQLYTQILSVYPTTANIVQVLGMIVAFDNGTLALTSKPKSLTPEVIGDILGMEEGEVRLVLRDLSSLIAFMGDGNEKYLTKRVDDSNVGSVYLIHASFRDYLVDSNRSGPFHVNEEEYRNWATTSSFALVTKWIGRSWRIPTTTRLLHSKTWDYFISYLPGRFLLSPKPVKDAIVANIKDLVEEFWKISSGGVADIYFPAMRYLMEILEHVTDPTHRHFSLSEIVNYELLRVFQDYQKMLDQCFISAFSKSRDMGDLLKSLPGIVVQECLNIQGMVELYGVKEDVLERLSKWALEPFLRSSSSYKLERHLSNFLQDRDRSHLHYCDPTLHHIFICRRFLSLLDGFNASNLQSYDLRYYFRLNLYGHLCAATEIFTSGENIPGDHPAVDILNGLCSTTYYYLDANQSRFMFDMAEDIIRSVLRWADWLNDRLKGATVFISGENLIERLRQLIDRIYREILCIETLGSITTITICAPLRGIDWHLYGTSPETPPYRPTNLGIVQLSPKLLAWESVNGRISSSFTDFMTTQERSGPLYVSPDVYHTQITEYSLGRIECGTRIDWSFQEHISRALPTETIFNLLRSNQVLRSIRNHSAKSTINLLEIIIKWLEGLRSERPSDLYDHFYNHLQAEIAWEKKTAYWKKKKAIDRKKKATMT